MNLVSVREFKESGLLMRVNMEFFHPLGMALAVKTDEESGEMELLGIVDNRDDPDGMIFSVYSPDKAAEFRVTYQHLSDWIMAKHTSRLKSLGYIVQPIESIIGAES